MPKNNPDLDNLHFTPLSSLAEIVMGQSPDSKFVNDEQIGSPFLQGNGEFTTKYPKPIHWVTRPGKVAKNRDILISVRAPVGEINIADQDYCIGRGLAAIRFKNRIDLDYGWYAINYYKSQINRFAQGSTFLAVNSNNIRSIEIPILEESAQRAIADILTTVDDAIEKTEALIHKYQRIKQGLLQDLLTRGVDENGELRDSFEINPCLYNKSEFGFFPKHWDLIEIENKLHRVIDYRGKTPRKASDGIPLITAKNVRAGYLDPEPREYIYSADYNSWMNRGIPNEGDVFFTTEAPLGNVARVPGYQHAVGQRIITLQPKPDELESSFLFWLLLAPLSGQRIQQKSTGSTAVGIKSSVFIKIPFPFPPISEQKRICQILDQAQCIVLEEESKLVKLKLLKRGLMQDLLTGKVRVNTLLER